MSKTTEQKTEQRQIVVVTELVCDICGKEAEEPNSACGGEWKETPKDYMSAEVTVRLNETSAIEADVWGEVTSFDICPQCFVEKLVPWIKSFRGAEPHTYGY